MKKYLQFTVAVGALAGAVFGLLPSAAAAPSSAGSAQEVINRLTALGYNVGINGSKTVPLSSCTVTGISPGDPGTVAAKQFTTIWVDISCPLNN